jgi:hypothetical protein
LEQAKTLLRVQAALAKTPADSPATTLADLAPYFEEEARKTLAKAKLEDEVYDLLLKAEPPKKFGRGGRQAKRAALSALRRKAMCIADTVTRAEG